MKNFAALVALLLCGSASASPLVFSDPYPVGPGQPTSCSIDASGTPVTCVLRRNAIDGSVTPTGDLKGLPVGTYASITITVSNATGTAGCTGGPLTFICDGGTGTATSAPITVTLTKNGQTPSVPVIHITFP